MIWLRWWTQTTRLCSFTFFISLQWAAVSNSATTKPPSFPSHDHLLDLWPLIWWNENVCVCQETSFPCSLNNWSNEELVGMQFGSHTHILSLSSAHVLNVWTQQHVDTDSVVVTSCCVERWHKVYCPEPFFTDVLNMINFIDLAHTHTHTEAKLTGKNKAASSTLITHPNQVLLDCLWTKSKRLFCIFASLLRCWLWTYVAVCAVSRL